MMGSHGLVAKCVMFEEAVRVPCFIKLNGQNKIKKAKGPASQVDIVPTLLELMNKTVPENLDGKSLKKLAQDGGEVSEDNNVFIEWSGTEGTFKNYDIPECFKDKVPDFETLEKYLGAEITTIIDPSGWKYNWSSIGEDELYNLNEDSDEINNLAFDVSQEKRILSLRQKIKTWQKKQN